MSDLVLRQAREGDVPAITELLKAELLPPIQVMEFLETFWVLEEDGVVAGSTGLEVYGQSAMLRSVAVEPRLRGRQHGCRLVEAALEAARRRSVKQVYLFTVHAAGFFARYGFQKCPLGEFDLAVRQSWQYRALSAMPQATGHVTGMRLLLAGR